MKTAIINVKTEPALKKRAEQFAKNTGMSLSDVINLALRQALNAGRIVVEEPLVPNKKTAKMIKQAIADAKAGRNLSPAFDNIEDAIRYLELEK